MTFPKVSIVIPNWNLKKDLLACLASIEKLNYPLGSLEVIVVDNGSTDGSVKLLKGLSLFKDSPYQGIKIIENKTNLGFAKAVNLGAKTASSEIILITNNDVVFEKNCLQELVKTLGSDPQIGVVGGKVYWKNKNKVGIDGFRLNPYLAYHQFDLSGLNRKRECDWIPGNCFLIRRKLFLDFGGFDEKYFFYFEDIDFCLRIKKAGFKLLFTPQAIVYHGYGKTIFKEKMEKIFYLGYRSRWRCLFKNASPFQVLTSSVFLLIFTPLYQSYLTRRNLFQPMLKGLFYNLKKLPERN